MENHQMADELDVTRDKVRFVHAQEGLLYDC